MTDKVQNTKTAYTDEQLLEELKQRHCVLTPPLMFNGGDKVSDALAGGFGFVFRHGRGPRQAAMPISMSASFAR